MIFKTINSRTRTRLVLAANNSTATDYPVNTWVPPKGSQVAAGGNVTAAAATTTNATAG